MKFWFHAIFNGIILICVGVVIWLSNWGVLNIVWRRDWPIILIAVGVINLVKYLVLKK